MQFKPNIRVHDMSNDITREELDAAIARYLLDGGKVKRLSPQRAKNWLHGMRIKPFRNPSEMADKAIDKVTRLLDEKEVEYYEELEREDLEMAEYYNFVESVVIDNK